ncbi:MmgE/PrpD family protein [Paraburkholderia sp. HD33-4]|uniref:MmgE/PrpD family protein n=1 Tax=Paraburkholderia sp. HD33-4 TaxID=2883242 RepID=UPI001F280FB4|nr:MmgE/PrpD family protein [Paraburkholderia sp. HD33-4]
MAHSNFSIGRRRLLAQAGGAITAVAIPKGARAANATSPVMLRLSAYLAEAGNRPLPADVVEIAKQHILDTFAAMVSGSLLPPGSAVLGYARADVTAGMATIVASTLTATPVEAAFVNAMLAQSDETDDSNEFSQSHPGCAIVPAAFAMGEQFGVDGNRFLHAVTLGYDIGPRVTISFGALGFRNNSHKSTHAIAEVFGSAVAAGCIVGLGAQQMRWLLDYTAQQSAGIGAWTRDTQHMEKAFVFAGMPAKNGVMSALLVHDGFTGIDDIFSGPDNYFLAYAPGANLDELIKDLGDRYEIARTNIKKWSVGSPIQAPLDAMDNIFRNHRVEPDNVRSIVVRLAHTEARIVDNREIPDICLQHMVAVMLLDRTVSFQTAHDKARMSDPDVLRVRAKVKLIPSDELEALEPARHAIVEITLNDGTVLTDHVAHVRGTADNPMDNREVVRKATDLIEPVLGKANSAGLIERLMTLERLNDVRGLRPFLQKA